MSQSERESLQRQLNEARANFQLIEERKAEFVLGIDVPLQLIKEERQLKERIAELETRLVMSTPPVSPTAAAASNVSGGVNINGGKTHVGGDVTGRDKIVDQSTHGDTYHIHIEHAENLALGHGAQVSGSSDKESTVSAPTVP